MSRTDETPQNTGVSLDDLFVHERALQGIRTFQRAGVVEPHPSYLVGLTLPGHRGGPALIALVVLDDGRVIAARGKPWRGTRKLDINRLIEYDEHGLTANELRRYTKTWRDTFGGFRGLVVERESDDEVAHSMIEHYADIARVLKDGVEFCLSNPPTTGHWDPADAMVMSRRGTVCAVHGFTPSHALVNRLDIASDLKRAMTIAPLPADDPSQQWIEAIHRIHPSLPGLVAEAWAVRLTSPRAAVALYRTAAERVLPLFGVAFKPRTTLGARISALEAHWVTNPPEETHYTLARERARRERILATLDSLREMGNLIHQADDVTLERAVWSHSVLHVLLEAALKQGTLDLDMT